MGDAEDGGGHAGARELAQQQGLGLVDGCELLQLMVYPMIYSLYGHGSKPMVPYLGGYSHP